MSKVDKLKITCISETSWFDTDKLLEDIKKHGGMDTDQYIIDWDNKNSGGYSALIEYEKDNEKKYLLFDVGWNEKYMDYCFAREGVDKLLKDGLLNDVFISHEHMDHYWGLRSVTKIRNDFNLYIPKGFSEKGYKLLEEAGFKGNLIEVGDDNQFDEVYSLIFELDIILNVKNEQVLAFDVKDKGVVTVTGCCHPGVNNMLDKVSKTVGDNLYGLYGGLHISLLEDWNDDKKNEIERLKSKGLKKVAANHCTGKIAVEAMIEAGIPVVRGSAKFGSMSDLYVGNGDFVEF
ncbi:conserved hypothetical protein [Deferribacter desulfuricans SSM1]|uniref:Metallo-beta-lactamase domain-containing protein n=1 Tax=Deferribacter desulfuricans (strain DSM 14783 / JCM 11476 / NBRC 101012 / SSM1) TaxID=639282 RepID=D3PCD3_DEFDS|nr:hypothetical protein [Deferribacter desulfuricans]BAI80256.1 conserved hypothetical protein [Deferribacter desulfuricans SSM1]